MKFIRATVAALAFILCHAASAAGPIPLWSDLNDLIAYAPQAMPDAVLIRDALKSDARFTAGQVKFVFSPHFEYLPAANPNGNIEYRAVAMMADDKGLLMYRKFAIEVGGSPRQIVNVRILEDVSLKNMHFEISVGLIDHMVVVEDIRNDVMMVFPIGGGGLDENIMGLGKRILTPRYHGAWLDRNTVTKKRSDPAYYRNEAFMPLTNAAGTKTPIAFHITILSDDEWKTKGPNYLVRGFESHGCMRLRQKDLHEFFQVVENSADRRLPVNIDYFVWNRDGAGERQQKLGQVQAIHPYPVEENSYMRVANVARPGEPPRAGRDPIENLLIMERVNHAPNLGGLNNFSADFVTDLRMFDGLVLDFDKLR